MRWAWFGRPGGGGGQRPAQGGGGAHRLPVRVRWQRSRRLEVCWVVKDRCKGQRDRRWRRGCGGGLLCNSSCRRVLCVGKFRPGIDSAPARRVVISRVEGLGQMFCGMLNWNKAAEKKCVWMCRTLFQEQGQDLLSPCTFLLSPSPLPWSVPLNSQRVGRRCLPGGICLEAFGQPCHLRPQASQC